MQHYEQKVLILALPEKIFSFMDDHGRFSSHMGKSSWMMGGGKMDILLDEGGGKRVGSHIKLSGRAFGIPLFVDEAVTRYEPPRLKEWETVGLPRLLVIGHYRMRIEIGSQGEKSLLRVSIDYDLPAKNVWLGKLFGKIYARWCVEQVIKDTVHGIIS